MVNDIAPETRRSGARFLLAFAGLTAIALGALLAINVRVDPHGIFGTGRYPVLVATSRTEKLARLEALPAPPQALIMGSSTMMRVDPGVLARLTGFPAFNLSVDSAKSEDLLALLEYAVGSADVRPKLIVAGIAPRTFTAMANEGIDERLLSNAQLLRYVPMNPAMRLWRRASLYLGTLDWTYEGDVLHAVELSRASDPSAASMYVFEANGFLRIEEPYDRPGQYRGSVSQEVPGLADERREYFERFLARARELDTRVHIVVTPESPDHIEFQNRVMDGLYDRKNAELMQYLQGLAPRYPVTVHNFARIEAFDGLHEFMGYNHPSIRNGTLLLERMFAAR